MYYSRIEDHNRHRNTDVLYNPLRTVLLNPQTIAQHRPYINPAAQQSRVTHDYAIITPDDARNLVSLKYIAA